MSKHLKYCFIFVFIAVSAHALNNQETITTSKNTAKIAQHKKISQNQNTNSSENSTHLKQTSQASLNSLYKTNYNLRSPHYTQGNYFFPEHEGFLEQDLKDFIYWMNETQPGVDIFVFTKKQRFKAFNRYLDFMKTPKWIDWLNSEKIISENLLKEGKQIWKTLELSQREKIHQRALTIKRQYVKSTKNKSKALTLRLENVFVKKPVQNLAPDLKSTNHRNTDTKNAALLGTQGNKYIILRFGNYIKENWLKLLFVIFGFFLLSYLASQVCRHFFNR